MVKYDYSCPECGCLAEVAHSIRESPAVECPDCSAAMVREFGSGEHVFVKGGTLPTVVQHHLNRKNREDMDHAHTVRKWVKEVGQPKTREALAKADLSKAKHETG